MQFSVMAVFCFVLFGVALLCKDLIPPKVSFAPIQGPDGEVGDKATGDAFEFEVRRAAKRRARDAGVYYDAGSNSLALQDFHSAAVEFARSIESLPTLSAYFNEGLALRWLADYGQAKQVLTQGLDLARKEGNGLFEGRFLYNLGIVGLRTHEPDAEVKLRNAVQLMASNRDLRGQASASIALAAYLYENGQIERAVSYFRFAARIYKRLGDRLGEANVITNLANYDIDQLNYARALEDVRRALDSYRDLHYPQGESSALGTIGMIFYYQSDYIRAIDHYRRSLAVATKFGFDDIIARDAIDLCIVMAENGKPVEALAYGKEGARLAAKQGDPNLAAHARVALGIALREQGDLSSAVKELDEARESFRALRDQPGQVDADLALAETYLKQARSGDAGAICSKIPSIVESFADLRDKARALSCIGTAAIQQGRTADARAALLQADDLYTSHAVTNRAAQQVRRSLGSLPPVSAHPVR